MQNKVGYLPTAEIDILDAVLEAIVLIMFVFVLIMLFYAKKKNKIFASKWFLVMVLAIVMGIVSVFMDFFTELYLFDDELQFDIYRLIMVLLQIACLEVFALSLVLLFPKE